MFKKKIEKSVFQIYTRLMKNPEIRKKQEEWHPCI